MFDFLGGLVGAGASIFNGFANRSAAQALNDQNIANQNLAMRNRIQWTVADAQKAGINPLAALGNATQSFSNVSGDTGFGDSFKSAGHDLGRAIAAQSPTAQRAAELELKLTEAKIANVNADTAKQLELSSQMATKLGQPGTARVPMPVADPRGPVINLMQRARDRDGSIVWIPSAEAASPLQTLGAASTNAAMAARSAAEALVPALAPDSFWNFQSSGARGDAWRAANPAGSSFIGAP